MKVPRRSRSRYPLPLRSYGNTVRHLGQIANIRASFPVLGQIVQNMNWLQPNLPVLQGIVNLLSIYHERTKVITLTNPIYIRTDLRLGNFSDQQLYSMRITSRDNFRRIMLVLNFPQYIICNNGTKCNSEEAFLMLLDRMSFPDRLDDFQERWGREYSQISRILDATFRFIDDNHKHLVSNNSTRYFAHRFPLYNRQFKRKYAQVNGVPVPAWWDRVALFTDGTKLYTTKNYRRNFSGYKERTCLSFMDTTTPCGMIAEGTDPNPGASNDHFQQNIRGLGQSILQCQLLQGTNYETGTDKGFHRENGVRPMHNHLFNTPQQDIENRHFSSCRVTNEHDIGRVAYQWKYLTFPQVLQLNSHPLAVYRRVAILLTNAITCLDHNATSKFYVCPPPTIEQYFAFL